MKTLLLAAPVALFAACGAAPVQQTIDVQGAVGTQNLRGISLDGDNLDLLVAGKGIVTVDRTGAVVSSHEVGQGGLLDLDYRDLASLGEDRFILIANSEGVVYDAVTQQTQVKFCVEPMMPSDPLLIGAVREQKNDAVAQSSNLIVAAPRFYEEGRLVESDLRTYDAQSGAQLTSIDLMDQQAELTGLAVAGDSILAVQQNHIRRFGLDGVFQGDVDIAAEFAAGIAVDTAAGEVFVADANKAEVSIYTLDDIAP